MKLLSLFVFLAVSAFGQSLSFLPLNLNSTATIRQIVPMSNVPPMVQIFINDTTGSDAYSVTLSYHDADGTAHTVAIAQLAAFRGSLNTLAVFTGDAFAIDSVKVMPLKLTGAAVQQ